MLINGLKSKSPLANNALFSTEITDGKFINLYDIMLPDIPGKCGEKSTVQFYMDALTKLNIQVAASHHHWTGLKPFMLSIHSYNIGMCPEEFTKKTLHALKETLILIKQRSH